MQNFIANFGIRLQFCIRLNGVMECAKMYFIRVYCWINKKNNIAEQGHCAVLLPWQEEEEDYCRFLYISFYGERKYEEKLVFRKYLDDFEEYGDYEWKGALIDIDEEQYKKIQSKVKTLFNLSDSDNNSIFEKDLTGHHWNLGSNWCQFFDDNDRPKDKLLIEKVDFNKERDTVFYQSKTLHIMKPKDERYVNLNGFSKFNFSILTKRHMYNCTSIIGELLDEPLDFNIKVRFRNTIFAGMLNILYAATIGYCIGELISITRQREKSKKSDDEKKAEKSGRASLTGVFVTLGFSIVLLILYMILVYINIGNKRCFSKSKNGQILFYIVALMINIIIIALTVKFHFDAEQSIFAAETSAGIGAGVGIGLLACIFIILLALSRDTSNYINQPKHLKSELRIQKNKKGKKIKKYSNG